MMEKLKVRMIGGHLAGFDTVFGGAQATTLAFLKAFENDEEVDFKLLPSEQVKDIGHIKEFFLDADIRILDESIFIASLCESNNVKIDILGPTLRSPVKKYGKDKIWNCPYSVNWFYSHKIIRLNYNEEKEKILLPEFKGQNFTNKVTLIHHCVDTNYLKPNDSKERIWVLWAGNVNRDAKDFPFFTEIMKMELPKPFKFKVMTGYPVARYWETLDETAILVNTSKFESFCACLFEAMAKGVPTIYPKGLHGEGVHEQGFIQCVKDVKSFQDCILHYLEHNDERATIGKICREYCEKNASPEVMRNDLVKIFKEVINDRINTTTRISKDI